MARTAPTKPVIETSPDQTVADGNSTRTKILDAAEAQIESRGYNAVSFRELATELGIKSASIHYHFPSKADLAAALVGRYRARFEAIRSGLDQLPGDELAKLQAFATGVAESFSSKGRMCLCGILAAETSTLPPEVVAEVQGFFADNERWLAALLAKGKRAGTLRFSGAAELAARSFFGGIEGAMLAAWVHSDDSRMFAAARWLASGFAK